MDARAEGKPLPFAAVKPKITEALEKAEWARAAKAFADALVADARIEGLAMDAP